MKSQHKSIAVDSIQYEKSLLETFYNAVKKGTDVQKASSQKRKYKLQFTEKKMLFLINIQGLQIIPMRIFFITT